MKVRELINELERMPKDAEAIMRFTTMQTSEAHSIDRVYNPQPQITSMPTAHEPTVVLEWCY